MDLSKQKLYTIGEAAGILGVSITTLRRWDRSGKISVGRTPSGNRVFTEFDLLLLKKTLRPKSQESGSPKFQRPSFFNFKFISIALIILLLGLNVLNYSGQASKAVLGVETFIAPALEETAPLGSLLSKVTGLFKGGSFVIPLLGKSELAVGEDLNVKGKASFAKDIEGLGNLKIKGDAIVGRLITGIIDPYLIENNGDVQSELEIKTNPSSLGSADIVFEPGGLEKLRIKENGNVTVSTNLSISGNQTLSGNLSFSSVSSIISIENTGVLKITDGTNTLLKLTDNGTTGNLEATGDLKVSGNITLTGVINSNTFTSQKLVFAGSSASIYSSTEKTAIALDAGTTGAVNIASSSTGDINLGGGSSSTGCTITNSNGNISCSGDFAVNGGDITTTSTTFNFLTSTVTTLNVGSSSTSVVIAGTPSFTKAPTSAHTGTWAIDSSTWNVSNATLYINPATATADSNLLGVAVAGGVKFAIDAEGDIFARNLVLTGNTTTGTTTVSGDLTVEGNTTLGDATTDTLTINPATITLAGGSKTIDITGAATRTLTILNSTASQVADLDLSDGDLKLGGTIRITNAGIGTLTTLNLTTLSCTGCVDATDLAANSVDASELVATAVTAGSYGGSTAVPVLTIDADGRITAASTASISSAWSSITDPTANLSLTMAANTTTLTYNAATGASTNLFNLTDTASNTGTGYLLSLATASLSNALPLRVAARGNNIIDTTATGGVTIGNATAAQAVTVDAGTATLNLGNSNNAKTINIGTGTAADTINIGSGGTTADTITIGGLAATTINITGTVNVTGAIVGTSTIQGTRLISTVATGTAPLTVSSTTVVSNLNVSFLEGYSASSLYSQPQPNLILNSDFGRRNKWMTFMPEVFADTSGVTVITGGAASAASNILTGGTLTGGYWKATEGLSTWRDARYSAQAQAVLASGLFGVAKMVDANNGVWAYDDGTNFHLYKLIAGVATDVATPVAQGMTLNNWYWFELEAQGTTYIAKMYSSGANPVAKSSATLLQTLSGTVNDTAVTTGMLGLVSNVASSKWGGLSTGDGGVYVEGWGPESWTVELNGTKGGQAIGFDETADSGPIEKQWAMRAYIPATSRNIEVYQDTPDGSVLASTSYIASMYLKTSGKGGSGSLVRLQFQRMNSAITQQGSTTVDDAGETSWTRVNSGAITTEIGTRRARIRAHINQSGTATGTGLFLLPQLEQGSVATPWRNAPADDGPITWRLSSGRLTNTPNSSTATTVSTSAVEIDSRDYAGNLFFPWDAEVQVQATGEWWNTGTNYNFLDFYNAGSSWRSDNSAILRAVKQYESLANANMILSANSGPLNINAGKSRVALRWFVDAGTGTMNTSSNPTEMVVTASRGKFDLAEEYTVQDSSIEPGDVVRIANSTGDYDTTYHHSDITTIEKTDKGYDQSILGIISTAPGITLSSTVELNSYRDKPNLRPVALQGRVPVKVTNENGAIRRGDILTSSATLPGYAMKALKAGRSIGTAMEDFTCDKVEPCQGKVMTFVNLSFYDPQVYLADSGQLVISNTTNTTNTTNKQSLLSGDINPIALGDNGLIQNTKYQIQNTVTKETIERVGAFSDLFVANLKVGNLDTSFLKSELLDSLQLKIASISSRLTLLESNASISAVLSSSVYTEATRSASFDNLTILKKLITADLGITGSFNAGLLTINGLDQQLNNGAIEQFASVNTLSGDLYLQSQGLGGVNILAGKVTIDTNGNLKVLETITAKKYNVDTADSQASSLGKAVLPVGQTNIVINTSAVATDSAVFVTPETVVDVPLAVSQKTSGQSFKVEVSKPAVTDIKFNWWIVN